MSFRSITFALSTLSLSASLITLSVNAAENTVPASTPVPIGAPAVSPSPPAFASPTTTPAATASPGPTAVPTASPPSETFESPSPTPVPAPGATVNAPVQILELSLDDKSGEKITLEDAIKIGCQGSSDVLKSENDLHYNGTRLLQAYGQFLPSVYGSGSYAYNTGTVYSVAAAPALVSGSSKNASASITADLNLFNGLADFSNLKSSLLKKDSAELTVERAKEIIGLDIAQSFLQVVLDTKLVEIAKKNLQASTEREKLLEAQTEVGAKNMSDLFRQQAQLSLDQASLLSSENRTRTDQISLLRKIRLDVDKVYHFVDPEFPENRAEANPPAERQLMSEGLQIRVDLKASNETADAGHWDIHVAASNYIPKIDLLGSVNTGGHTLIDQNYNGANVVPPSQNSMSYQLGRQIEYVVALNVTWSIFDRFVTAQNVSYARRIADDADIDAENRRLQVQGEIRQAYGDYLTAIQQLHASKKGLDAAQKAYEVVEGRYSVGAASFLDLITSQSTLVEAESNKEQAVVNYELQTRALDLALGKKSRY
jgi:outer membrane protein